MVRMTLLAALLAALSGCTAIPLSPTDAAVHVGEEAAEHAFAKALVLEDQLNMLRQQQALLRSRTEFLLVDAYHWRQKSGDAWTNPALLPRERRAYDQMYRALAHEAEVDIERCNSLNQNFNARAQLMNNQRDNAFAQEGHFNGMRMALVE